MTSRKPPFELFYSSSTPTGRWLRAALATLAQSASFLCTQRWHGAQPVLVPVLVQGWRRS